MEGVFFEGLPCRVSDWCVLSTLNPFRQLICVVRVIWLLVDVAPSLDRVAVAGPVVINILVCGSESTQTA